MQFSRNLVFTLKMYEKKHYNEPNMWERIYVFICLINLSNRLLLMPIITVNHPADL